MLNIEHRTSNIEHRTQARGERLVEHHCEPGISRHLRWRGGDSAEVAGALGRAPVFVIASIAPWNYPH